MQYIAQRIGIFVKQKKRSKGFKTRFFVLDNQHNLLFTSNQAFIEKVIKTSDTVSEIIYKCSSKKKISIKKAKVGPLRLFYTIDQIPLANKNCFELLLENPKDNSSTSLIIFSFQDEQIFYLHDFLKNYDSYVEKTERMTQQMNPIKKIHAAYVEEEKDAAIKTDNSSQVSKDEEELREKFKILAKIISDLDNEKEINKNKKDDNHDPFEDLKPSASAKVEEIELLQLDNGNSFSGKMRNGKPHGQGTEFLKDGTSYVGEFRNGKWHGLGYMVNSNLDMTYAEFINGRPVGI